MKSQNSNSEFGAYTTNGELLEGTLSGYSDIAGVLDSKRVALYIECDQTAIILGTRLMVRIVGGREERAIYFQKYPKNSARVNETFISNFYSDAITGIQKISRIKYEALGIWEKDDWNFSIKPCTFSSLSFVIGKILLKQPVSVKITDFSLAISAITRILQTVSRSCEGQLTIIFSHYPVDADVIVSPNATRSDIELSERGESFSNTASKTLIEYYEGIYTIFSEFQERDPAYFKGKTREEIGKILTTELINDSRRIQNILLANPKELIDIYRDETGALYQIAAIAVKHPQVFSSFDEDTSMRIIEYRVSLSVHPLTSSNDLVLIRHLYRNIKTETKQRTIQKLLLSNSIQEDYFVSDIVSRTVQTGDVSDLRILFESSSTVDPQKMNKIVSTVFSAHHHDQKKILQYFETIIRYDVDRSDNGQDFLATMKSYYKRHNYDIKKLNRLLLSNNRSVIPIPQRAYSDRSRFSDKLYLVLIIVIVIACLCLGYAILGYLHIVPAPDFLSSAGNQTSVCATFLQNAPHPENLTSAAGLNASTIEPTVKV